MGDDPGHDNLLLCLDDDWLSVIVSDLYCVQCINRRPTYKLDCVGCSLTLLLGPNHENDA